MKKLSVLIIDDSEDDRYLLRRQLRQIDFVDDIYEIPDGQLALDFFRRHKLKRGSGEGKVLPMVAFLDINMPFLDGNKFIEAYKFLRENSPEPRSTFFVYSSSENSAEIARMLEYDFVKRYLVKGQFTTEQLHEELSYFV